MWDVIAVPHRKIKRGRTGRDIRGAARAAAEFAKQHPGLGLPTGEGLDGTADRAAVQAIAEAAFLLGIGSSEFGPVSVYTQTLLRSPGLRNQTQRSRALQRQADRRKAVKSPKVPGNEGGWHPNARRVPYGGAGTFVSGYAPRLVWHTTESSSLPSYGGSAPHFTFDPKTGDLWQHYPISVASRALMHTRWPETNNGHAIQVELLGFSDAGLASRAGHPERAVVNWTDADYARIAEFARWIEKHAGVKRTGGGLAYLNTSHPMSDAAWVKFNGHCGHQHVPQNLHWDPSGSFKIEKVV
jgi:hypothetical protein